MEYVLFQDTRLPFYIESNLRALDRVRLREHALLLNRSLGGRIVGPVPDVHEDLLLWVLRVQKAHLEPLRGSSKLRARSSGPLGDLHAKATDAHAAAHQASMDVITALQEDNRSLSHRVALLEDLVREMAAEKFADRALDYVLFEGTRLPLFVENHLRTLDRARLQEHAQLLYRSIGARIEEPDLHGDLAGWILQVQSRHLEPLKNTSTLTYRDAFGDTVKTKSSTDIFGDRTTSRTVTDPYGDKTTTKTSTDIFGDKMTTKTSTDIFGDKTTTRTTRDALGDTTKTTTFSDPYGDKVATKSSTDIFGNKTSTTTLRDAFGDTYKTSSFETPSDCVVLEGTRLPLLVEAHLKALDRARLRDHAQFLYRSLGGRISEPNLDGDLVNWVLQVQSRHLEPLKTPAERALQDFVLFEGTRLPLFVESHLRALDRARLREHAQLLYQSLGARIDAPVPELDGDLLDWVLRVQHLHLEPLKTSSHYRAANGDIVDTKTSMDIFGDKTTTRTTRDVLGDTTTKTTFSDPYGDKVTTKTSTDIFGDKTLTRTTRDVLGDTTKTTTFSDPYGDKVTTKTSTDIFGDRKTTRTARDALGDTTKSTTLTDPYGNKVTNKTSTDIFGDKTTTRTTRDALGDTAKTTTFSDPYGDRVTTKTSTDIFGDRKTTRSTRDMFGDTNKTTTASDRFGNKVTTRSAKDIFGDRTQSTTVRDRFGDRWNNTTSTDAIGNRQTTSSYSGPLSRLGGGVSPIRNRP